MTRAQAVKAFLKDLAERVGSTFAAGALAAAGSEWAASGLDVTHFASVSAAEKVGSAAVVGGVAALVSLAKGLLAANVGEKGTASLVSLGDELLDDAQTVIVRQTARLTADTAPDASTTAVPTT